MALARASFNAGQAQGPRPATLAGPPTLGLGTANNAFGMPPAGTAPNPFGGGGGFGFGTQTNPPALGTTNPFGAPAAGGTSIFGNTTGATRPNLTLGFGQTSTFGAQQPTSFAGQTSTFGAQTNPTALAGGSAFGSTSAPATNFSFGTGASAGAATPGLFGSTMSPFGQAQVLGKRGKH